MALHRLAGMEAPPSWGSRAYPDPAEARGKSIEAFGEGERWFDPAKARRRRAQGPGVYQIGP